MPQVLSDTVTLLIQGILPSFEVTAGLAFIFQGSDCQSQSLPKLDVLCQIQSDMAADRKFSSNPGRTSVMFIVVEVERFCPLYYSDVTLNIIKMMQ